MLSQADKGWAPKVPKDSLTVNVYKLFNSWMSSCSSVQNQMQKCKSKQEYKDKDVYQTMDFTIVS